MPSINKDHAVTICRKLNAVKESKKGSAHTDYSVYYGGKYLGSFGIRHGSNRDQSHDHIPDNLDIPCRLAWELGSCTKDLPDYISYMRKQGMLPEQSLALADPVKAPVPRPWDEIDWVGRQAAELVSGEGEGTPQSDISDNDEPPDTDSGE
jgi:hypothetical protein